MTHIVLTPTAARTALEATVRYQLHQAWERGLDTPPRGVNASADAGAAAGFDAVMAAAEDLAAAITTVVTAHDGRPRPAGGQ